MGSQGEGFKKERELSRAVYCEDRNGTIEFSYKEGLWTISFMLQVQRPLPPQKN